MKRSTAIGLQRTATGKEAVHAADSHLDTTSEAAEPSPAQGTRRQRGFTVVELVVVVSIAAILASVAFPSLMNMVRSSSVTSATNQLVASLNWARNQAVVQHASVRVCKSANVGTATTPGCDATAAGNGYEKGWLVFIDIPIAGVVNYTYDSATDTLLKKVFPDNNNKITMNGTPSSAPSAAINVGFTPLGMLAGASVSGTTVSYSYIVVCDDRGWANSGRYAKVISISTAGRIATAAGNNQTAISTNASSCTPT